MGDCGAFSYPKGGEAVANAKNLIPNEKRTPSERRGNAKKAGKASGEARRQKRALRECLEPSSKRQRRTQN